MRYQVTHHIDIPAVGKIEQLFYDDEEYFVASAVVVCRPQKKLLVAMKHVVKAKQSRSPLERFVPGYTIIAISEQGDGRKNRKQ